MTPRNDDGAMAGRGDPDAVAPQPLPEPAGVPEPRDEDYPGTISLAVDATDVLRGIYRVREVIPVERAGPIMLLYPKWLPGFHAPQAPIELFAGLVVRARGETLTWKRHPVTVNAFHVDVPDGADRIELEFQFLSPTDPAQGRVIATPDMLALQWNTVLLYPAGHFARRIAVDASVTLPDDWEMACALEGAGRDGACWRFATTPLDVLVDSPVLAGRHLRRVALDESGTVSLNIVADQPRLLEATPEQIEPHRALVVQADRLFRARHFDRYEILLALSDEMTSIGVEHHRSCDAVSTPAYFADWDASFVRRDTIPHEYVHSWNGKHRRGADSWTPCFEKPIRNSLMWVYEGQTQYWSQVLCARAELWSVEQTLGALAQTAARYDVRPGSRWRPTIDTTRDPIIAARAPLPWASWQRSEDYYSEGALVWLDVDTRLRQLTDGARSLDDFARDFFGHHDGGWATRTYVFDDVVDALAVIAPFDWAAMFHERLTDTHRGAPLAGIERGGYRLIYRDHPSAFEIGSQSAFARTDLSYSVGLTFDPEGVLTDVMWDGPAFHAALTVGTRIVAVNGRAFAPGEVEHAVAAAVDGEPVELTVAKGRSVRTVAIPYHDGLRHPHLERVAAEPDYLGAILAPLAA
ncbi:MAG TPA: peptidase M61 [Sphingomonas sp.]|uniref:M61 family metallopeptidase n=1 Tax=Sphingomonas sp. TaxID=28214 RepID=UPI002ED86CFA